MTDLHGDRDQAEVAGQRGLGQEIDRQFVDLLVQLIQRAVFFLDRAGQVVVPLHQRFDGAVDRRLGLAGHGQQRLLELIQFLFQVLHSSVLSRSGR